LRSSIQKGIDFVNPQHAWVRYFDQLIANKATPS
jgi:hypothetical protein